MDKRKGYVLLLINAGVRNSVSERKKSRRLLHCVYWHPVITLASKRAFMVLLLELEASPLTITPPMRLSNQIMRNISLQNIKMFSSASNI